MEELDRSFDIFNDRYFDQKPISFSHSSSGVPDCATFSRFLDLPKELRLEIWTCHLRHRRFLRVLLEETTTGTCGETAAAERSPWHEDDSEDYEERVSPLSATPEQPGVVGAGHIRITFLDASIASLPAVPLVCREAYQAYTSFYPIRLPSLVRAPSDPSGCETRQTVAHLHPGNDIISVEAPHPPQIIERSLLPYFLHTLLQHDTSPASLRFGVRNLCLDLKQLGSDRDERDSGTATTLLPDDVLISARTTISHLRNLYLRLTTSHLEPRITSGPITTRGTLPWYNASMPILPPPSWKDFSSQVEPVDGGDTRLEAPEGVADLRQVWIGSQIRPSMEVWEDLERAWGVERDEDGGVGASGGRDLRVRALIALAPETSDGMEDFLRKEKAQWLGMMDPTSDFGAHLLSMFELAQQRFLVGYSSSSPPPDASVEAVAPDDWYLRRREQTAAGYWLVDPKVLGGAKTTILAGRQVADLSEQGKAAIKLWVFRGHP